MTDGSPRSFERPAFGALVAAVLAPIVAHGLWRPLVHVFGLSGGALGVTGASLGLAATVVLVQHLRPDRTPWLAVGLGALGAVGASIGLSLGVPGFLALVGVVLAITFVTRQLALRLPTALDGLARRHKVLTTIYVALASATVVSTARLSVFMGDAAQVDQQVLPGEAFVETHSCLTAYVHAQTLGAQRVENLYDERRWQGSNGLPQRDAGMADPYRPFVLDYFAYPPPFLLIMAPLGPLDGDFAAQRALWFGFNGLLLAAGLWIVTRWLDGPGGHRTLLLAPLFLGSLPVLVTLQVGNFQIAVVVISVLAMVAFEEKRPMLGGVLLAFAILSKLSPGILGIVLLAQRRWIAAAWTAAFGVLFVALSALFFGVGPLESFVSYTLPRLGSGEGFAFLDDDPFSILTNMSPFGVPFKLQLLGLDVGDPWALGRRIGRAYVLVPIILAAVVGHRRGDRRSEATTWMALLVLAALQSPFAPGYIAIGLLWALTLVAADVRRRREGIGLVLLALLATVLPHLSMVTLSVFSLLQTTLAVGVPCALLLWRLRSPTSIEISGTATGHAA